MYNIGIIFANGVLSETWDHKPSWTEIKTKHPEATNFFIY